ncbi:MAG TPA: hypothetical protein DIW82_03640 [Corynebacterium nuruki]|uniref:Secreted protein n=1 Tax=Corynebacterium nuruki TaxID=1032851 RepID=A0A3D4SX89_9CORY|nr:hypothetical protein [Corynebacterium nuruki]
MTIKKSLFALGTAATVAIAGAGVANAADLPEKPTSGSATLSSPDVRDPEGSIDAHGTLASYNDEGAFDTELAFGALETLAEPAKAIAAIAGIGTAVAGSYVAVVNASDVFQGVVSDTQAFLESQGIL